MPLLAVQRSISKRNRGGIRELLIAPSAHIEQVVFDAFERVGDIQMKPGKSFYFFRGRLDLGFFTQSFNRSGGFGVVSQTINLAIDGFTPAGRLALAKLSRHYSLAVLVKDNTGQWHFFGISYLSDRREWVFEKLRRQGGSTNSGTIQQEQLYVYSIQGTTASEAPHLAFDPSTLPIVLPSDDDLVADIYPPNDISHFPEIGATYIDASTTEAVLGFNEPIVAPALGVPVGNLRKFDDDTLVRAYPISNSIFTTLESQEQRIRFSLPVLEPNTAYYWDFPQGYVEDLAGNQWAGMTKATSVFSRWYFKTKSAPSTDPPNIVSVSPPPLGTIIIDPSQGTLYRFVYDRPIVARVGLIELKEESPVLQTVARLDIASSGLVSILTDGSQGIVDLDIESLLENGKRYSLTLPAGAVQSYDFVPNAIGVSFTFDVDNTPTSGAFSNGFSNGFDT